MAPKKPKPRVFTEKDALALAKTIDGSRPQFASAFRAAQAGRSVPLDFEVAVKGAPDYTAAFAEAFTRASTDGWLEDLCVACLKAEIVGDGFTRVAARATQSPSFARLQQMVDADRGYRDAGLVRTRFIHALDQVCRIEIDTKPKGTGFLIRSDLVMTAYHVVSSLLQPDDTPKPGSAGRLKVRFGYERRDASDGTVTLVDGVVFRVNDNWLLKLSPCTKEELLEQLPAQEDQLEGFWDFVVIKLAETPGVARNGLKIGDRPVKRGHRLTIFQHPKGDPLAHDTSIVRGFLGKKDRFRIVHEVNTDDGSSGSPCLNDDYQVVGLHQAEMPAKLGTAKPDEKKSNRAVPMQRILSFWDPATAPLFPPAVGRVTTVSTATEPQHPVFGRSRLQEWVAKSAADAAAGAIPDRFLVVGGPTGCGKSFSADIIRAMLPPRDHLVIECHASTFNAEMTAVGFATKYLLEPLKADGQQLPALTQANTSDNAWLNYQFVGDLLNLMDQSRQDRMVWIVLDELDDVVLPDQGAVRKLLDLLYARAPQNPWIRFVLLGLEGIPVPDLVSATERDFPTPPAPEELTKDVYDYMLRRLENQRASDNLVTNLVRLAVEAGVKDWLAKCNGKLDHPQLLAIAASSTIFMEKSLGLRKSI